MQKIAQTLLVEKKHNTLSELKFLDGIVSGAFVAEHSVYRAAKALRGYVATVYKRTFDHSVDVKAVFNHANRLLAEVEQKLSRMK